MVSIYFNDESNRGKDSSGSLRPWHQSLQGIDRIWGRLVTLKWWPWDTLGRLTVFISGMFVGIGECYTAGVGYSWYSIITYHHLSLVTPGIRRARLFSPMVLIAADLISPQERSGLRHLFFLIEGNQSQASNCTVYDTEEAKSLESAIYCKEAGSWFQHFNRCLSMFTVIKRLWLIMKLLHDRVLYWCNQWFQCARLGGYSCSCKIYCPDRHTRACAQ